MFNDSDSNDNPMLDHDIISKIEAMSLPTATKVKVARSMMKAA